MNRDIELDLRQSHTWPLIRETIMGAGGFPLVVLPVDNARQVLVKQGRLCRDRYELARAVGWAFGVSPLLRLVPVEPVVPLEPA